MKRQWFLYKSKKLFPIIEYIHDFLPSMALPCIIMDDHCSPVSQHAQIFLIIQNINSHAFYFLNSFFICLPLTWDDDDDDGEYGTRACHHSSCFVVALSTLLTLVPANGSHHMPFISLNFFLPFFFFFFFTFVIIIFFFS